MPTNKTLLFLGEEEFSRACTHLYQKSRSNFFGNKSEICRLLGYAYMHLGRAALFAEDSKRSLHYFEQAQEIGGLSIRAYAIDLLQAEADRCARLGQGREVVQRWQDMLCLLGENSSDYMYQRLSDAYAANKQGFGGTPAENRCWGDCHKHDVLEWLHERLKPDLYLEFGVDQGLSLARAKGPAIGVDPRPQLDLKVALPTSSQIFPLSSDAYFRKLENAKQKPVPDLVLIDGMHLFEFALRDFINVERYSAAGTLVVIDDIFPCHPVQGARRRKSTAWAGDIWKLHSVLRDLRPDLTLVALNSFTTGLLLVAGLDSGNKVLGENYDAVVAKYKPVEQPLQEVLERYGAIPSAHPVVAEVVEVLAHSKATKATVREVQAKLQQLHPRIVAVEKEFLGRAESLAGHCCLERAFTPIGECDGSTVFQVFFPEAQLPHYREQASQKLRLSATGDWSTFSINIPDDVDLTKNTLRIDPAGRVGTVQIQWIQITDKASGAVLYRADSQYGFEQLQFGGGLARLDGEQALCLSSTTTDSQIYLPLLSANESGIAEQQLKLEICLCFNGMLGI